ncbi:efflux RND transporter periplasmic adaptor subunit [Salisaeta longa]|uniref:efflux RND transporter periplasmic adaptor subunit n=1 Tax=Salisaeta longa TaxID=503170 RepID=UPI000A00BCE4|nr:efflux RND transporter periplasmic adaptor subunit [Salisaeta longa]
MALRFSLLLTTFALLLAGCGGGRAGGPAADGTPSSNESGHAHNGGTSSIAVTAWSAETELFFEHPPLVAGQRSGPWAIHVTQRRGYQLIGEGTLTLRFRRSDGAAYVHTANAPSRPGIFTPQPTIPEAGTFRLFMIVGSPQLRDTVEVGDIRVYASADEAEIPPAPEGDITFLKEQQWAIDFGVATTSVRSVRPSVEAPGEIVPVAGQYARVSAPVSGLTPAEANLGMPAPGDRVRKGETLAVLAPSGGTGSYVETKARVERLKREVARAKRLYAIEAIPEKQLIEARHDLEVAQAALQSIGGGEGAGFNYRLRAPITGQVQERHLAPGSRVEVGTVLYTIVDPRRVWVRLHVPAEQAARANAAVGGVFTVAGSETPYTADRVVSTGAALDADTRTLPVLLAAANPEGRLKIGMMVDGRLLTGTSVEGVTIPNAAIQIEDGQPVAYVQTGGESFARRPLQLGPTDGYATIVERGLEAGEHVVTNGAYQVYLASLNASEMAGHGHPH